MEPESVALWCGVPLAVAVAQDSLEVIAERRHLRANGLFGLGVLVTGRPRTLLNGPLAAPLCRLFLYPAVLALPLAQLAAAAVLVTAAAARTPTLAALAGIAALVILAARMLLHLRNQFGIDGSNHMILVCSTVIAAVLLLPDRQAQSLALYYLAGQLLLCYAAAGGAKALSPVWRSGSAIPRVTSTITYGSPRVGALLSAHPPAGLILSWSVIAFECAAPLLILAGTPGAVAIIAGGLAFHISVAAIMGLNTFLWSFAAAYPALLYLAHQIDHLWH
jgi:hypothetical protein